MKRYLFILLLCLVNAYAEVVAGVAIRVNGHAITMYEIKQIQQELNLSRQAAIDFLINERLKDDEIERFKISIDDFKIEEEIENIALSMNLSKEAFLRKLDRENIDYKEYKNNIKKQMQSRELMQKILQSNISITSEEELFSYYNANKSSFSMPSEIKVTRYFSASESSLQQAIKSPKKNYKDVEKIDESISMSALSPQIAQVFISTPNNKFTPVLSAGGSGFVSFFIKNKIGGKILSFEEAKGLINQKIMQQKEQNILTEHFNKIRSSASIVTLRE